MAKIIEGNLILDKDTVFDEELEVHGSIIGKNGNRYNLTVNGNIKAEDIHAGDIHAGDIDAGNISAWDISARNIDAKNITAGNLDVGDIDAWDINAWNIKARDISAEDINAWNIKARNISAWTINTGDISARNIATYFILCEKLEQEPGSTLYAKKVINNRSTYKISAIDNSQFIKQEESIKQEKCNACGQVLRGKESNKLSEKLK